MNTGSNITPSPDCYVLLGYTVIWMPKISNTFIISNYQKISNQRRFVDKGHLILKIDSIVKMFDTIHPQYCLLI